MEQDDDRRRDEMLAFRPQQDLVVAAQPIVDLDRDRVVAYDMLSRFPNSSATPAEVFAEAQELGIIVAFELLAARCALDGLSVVPPTISLAIRASLDTLVDEQFAALLRWSAAEQVIVQFSASDAMTEHPALFGAVEELREMGVRLAVSGVLPEHCRRPELSILGPHLVKLHGSLVARADEDGRVRDQISEVVQWADAMQTGVIAVNVERGSQLRALFDLGVRNVQGFHLGRPADFLDGEPDADET